MNCWAGDFADPPRPPWLPWVWAAIAIVTIAFWWAVGVIGGWL